jgi:signal transduction histidine kinase
MSIVRYAETKELKLVFDTDIEEKFIVCDPDFIERIMLNLFSNSLKFTNHNGRIMVNIYNNDEGVKIIIKDTGIGIPVDKLQMIFERFRQVDDSLYRNNEGSGIGLSLVKALVEAHKGTISVASVVGEGTEFVIYLPTGVLPDNMYSSNSVNNNSQGMIDRINVEFSDIYSFSDIEKNQTD